MRFPFFFGDVLAQAQDYDAQLGRLVFSRVADATVRYDAWQLERLQCLLFFTLINTLATYLSVSCCLQQHVRDRVLAMSAQTCKSVN